MHEGRGAASAGLRPSTAPLDTHVKQRWQDVRLDPREGAGKLAQPLLRTMQRDANRRRVTDDTCSN